MTLPDVTQGTDPTSSGSWPRLGRRRPRKRLRTHPPGGRFEGERQRSGAGPGGWPWRLSRWWVIGAALGYAVQRQGASPRMVLTEDPAVVHVLGGPIALRVGAGGSLSPPVCVEEEGVWHVVHFSPQRLSAPLTFATGPSQYGAVSRTRMASSSGSLRSPSSSAADVR